MKYWRIGLLGVVVSALALSFILSQVDLSLLGAALVRARYGYLLPTVVFLLVGLVTRAIRWRVLLSAILPLGRSFNVINVAYLVNGILPLRIGEVARVFLATRAEPPVPALQAASTIIVERVLDLLAVVVLLGLALGAVPVPAALRLAGIAIAPVALLGFLALIFLAGRRILAQRLLAFVMVRMRGLRQFDVAVWLDQFLDGLSPLTKSHALFQALLWTAISWGFSVVAGYFVMLAFYERGDWAVTALYIAAAALSIALPAVPGNIGTYEASILLAMQAFGYDVFSGTALAFAVTVHGVNVGVHTVTGVVGLLQEGITLGQLSQGVRQIQERTN